jgi:hypothetical protein
MKQNPRISKIFLLIPLALALTGMECGSPGEEDFSTQVLNARSVAITNYTGKKTDVTIPAKIGGRAVTEIGNKAFGEWGITSVKIPGTVTSIGEGAFNNNKLKSVTIPASVTKVGDWAFSGNQLASITIGANVEFNDGEVTLAIEELDIPSYILNATFGDNFGPYYHSNGAKAGTYTLNGGKWSYKP